MYIDKHKDTNTCIYFNCSIICNSQKKEILTVGEKLNKIE